MVGLCSWWDLPWCFGGDFNITRFPCEHGGDSQITKAMSEFSDLISELQLIDLHMVGGEFTWSNRKAWSQLDRFFTLTSWEALCPDVRQKKLQKIVSDHYPILLDCGGIVSGRRYFKFENMWLKDEGFVERVRRWWDSYNVSGTPSFVLTGTMWSLLVM
ncbi:hypothetical protein CIPAW_11G155500 [Carya illinoinensis]|uniref:Endonuclease/exonuclease/phosphatase domain-containing protein n=1 Tax=Carya illinoinensis TaxID=32201 RepID=A0A8T1NZT9_CARIL|nr:hypothetical protein CIPAW_11G155500 [Carya illinoinensis]